MYISQYAIPDYAGKELGNQTWSFKLKTGKNDVLNTYPGFYPKIDIFWFTLTGPIYTCCIFWLNGYNDKQCTMRLSCLYIPTLV